MRYAKIKRRIWIGFWSALAASAWSDAGFRFVKYAFSQEWLSSFVEISFALNSSLSVGKVRSWLLRPFFQKCYNMIQDLKVNNRTVKVNEDTIKALKKEAECLYEKLERRVQRELNWVVVIGLFSAFLSLVVLLTGVPAGGVICYIPILFCPVAVYVFDVFVEYRIISNEFEASCERCIEREEVERETAMDSEIAQILHKLDARPPMEIVTDID